MSVRSLSRIAAGAVAAAALAAAPVRADEVQKTGTTSLQTLKISTSVRAVGLADAYVALADDIQSVFWNPAGLVHLKGTAAYFAQINMPAEVRFNAAALARNLGRRGVVGVHVLALHTGDMPVRTIFQPYGTGENFVYYDFIGGLSYAARLTDRFVYGLNLRLVMSAVDDSRYTGPMADLGVLYETALRSLKLGMSLQNFGPDVKYSGTYLDYLDQGRRNRPEPAEVEYGSAPPPTIYRLGVSADLFRLSGCPNPHNWDGLVALEMSHPNDNRERINLGLEMTYLKIFSVRTGYKLRYRNVLGYDEERWTVGMGIRVPVPGWSDRAAVAFDYAFMDFGLLQRAADGFMNRPHRMSLAVNF